MLYYFMITSLSGKLPLIQILKNMLISIITLKRSDFLKYWNSKRQIYHSAFLMPIPTEVQTQTGKTRTYNITLWRYRVTIVVTEKQKHIVLLSYVLLPAIQIYLVLHKSDFLVNLYCRQQQNLRKSLFKYPIFLSYFFAIFS